MSLMTSGSGSFEKNHIDVLTFLRRIRLGYEISHDALRLYYKHHLLQLTFMAKPDLDRRELV